MYYALPCSQLKSQVRRVLGKDACCIVLEGKYETISDINILTIICGNDVQSRLTLLNLAKTFLGEIYLVDLVGEFTSLAPLAVSDAELTECLKAPHILSDDDRKYLIEEYDNLPESQYYQLQDGHIAPLTQEEITKFILQHITEPMKIAFAVGECMGYAPYGWLNTDSFYIQQIEKLAKIGLLEIDGSNSDTMQNIVRPLKTA